MKVDLESKELMSACLRKIPGLSKVKVVDAVWIWTEPHSMRLKIKLTIQKEVLNGAILQQAKIVEFTIRNQQCKTCQSFYAQGVWHAVVQVRQHVPHKRTFFYLEQVLLKYNAHSDCLQITVSINIPILCLFFPFPFSYPSFLSLVPFHFRPLKMEWISILWINSKPYDLLIF